MNPLKEKVLKLREERDGLVAALEQIVNTATSEERDFTAEENVSRGRLEANITAKEDQLRAAEAERKSERKVRRAAEARSLYGYGGVPMNFAGGSIRVNAEERTYAKGNGVSYLQDLCAVGFGPGASDLFFPALERMQRHAQENHVEALEIDAKSRSSRSDAEQYFLRQMVEAKNPRKENRGRPFLGHLTSYRALSTSSGAGGEFVPPLYMTADWIAYARAGRVFADACHKEDLPDGTMSINIPKVTGGTSVGTQANQNTNVSDTDITTAFVTFPVVTKAGQQVVSLQLLERSPIAFDEVVMQDLGLALATQVDDGCLYGPGSGDVTGVANTSGINTVTWTQASPTIKGLYGQIGVGKADISTTRFLPPTHMFMTPTRWEWIAQSFDSNSRPLVVPGYNGPFDVLAVSADAATAQGVVGHQVSGLQTFEDPNIPSNIGGNQDEIIISRMDENWLMESPVVTRALPQTYGNQLSVLLQLYEYMAFTAARYPIANSVLTGTGLAAPTFNS